MRVWYKLILILLFPCLLLNAQQERNVVNNFKVSADSRVLINGISGLNIKINTWDKNEAGINVKVKVKSTDSDFEKEYCNAFNVTCRYEGNDVIIEFIQTDKKGSWSVFDILKGDFKYSYSKEITGEILLPPTVSINGNFDYSDIKITGFSEDLVLKGKGNQFTIKECTKVSELINEYGENFISKSAGRLNADIHLSPITIEDFSGQARIKSVSTKIKINRFNGPVNLECYDTQGNLTDVMQGINIYSEYSTLILRNISGLVDINDKNSSYDLYTISGLRVKDGYRTTLYAEGISAVAKAKIFLTSKNGKFTIAESSGEYFIDDDGSRYTMTGIKGVINYSGMNGSFTGRNLTGDWNSNSRSCVINLYDISANNIKAVSNLKKISMSLASTPKNAIIQNENSDVELTLNSDIKTTLALESVQGSISSDFSMEKRHRGSKYEAAAKIGGGGALIEVNVKNGDIRIFKR